MSTTYPTRDEELRQEVRMAIMQELTPITGLHKPELVATILRLADSILGTVEARGYYKGTPSSIEEALNSGDGTYRP